MQINYKPGYNIPMVLGLFVALTAFAFAQPAVDSKNQSDKDPGTDHKLNVAVLLYDGALLLDYGVAAEMFLAADFMRKFNVFTVGGTERVSLSILGITTTDFTFDNSL